MDPISIALILGGVLTAISAAGQTAGAFMSSSASKKQSRIQMEQEELRKKQANIDASRKKREIIRQQQMAMAQAQSTAVNQGAESGSALEGAYGGISGQSGNNLVGVSQNQQMGNQMFGLNARLTRAGNAQADAGTLSATANGLGTLGGAILNNYEKIGKIGTYGTSS